MGRKGNPNWGKLVPFGPLVPTVTSFEEAVKELELQPDQYLHSTCLREWARRNKDSKFIPEFLLQGWGFETAQKPSKSNPDPEATLSAYEKTCAPGAWKARVKLRNIPT